MSTLTQLIGGSNGPVTSIVNRASDGGNSTTAAANTVSGKGILSGALTAATLATAVSVTGRGRLNFVSAAANDTTARTIRIKITVDGVSIFDATSASVSASNAGIVAVGAMTTSGPTHQPIDFNESLLIQVASSLTETDKITVYVNYEVWE